MPKPKPKSYEGSVYVGGVTFTPAQQAEILYALDLEDADEKDVRVRSVLARIERAIKTYHADHHLLDEMPTPGNVQAEIEPFLEVVEALRQRWSKLSDPARDALRCAWSDDLDDERAVMFAARVDAALDTLPKLLNTLVMAGEGARRDCEQASRRGAPRKMALPHLIQTLAALYRTCSASPSPEACREMVGLALRAGQVPRPNKGTLHNLVSKAYGLPSTNKVPPRVPFP